MTAKYLFSNLLHIQCIKISNSEVHRHTCFTESIATEQIMKLTGHKCIESLIKSYDHTLDNGAKVDMTSTIGYLAQLSRGNISKVEGMIL